MTSDYRNDPAYIHDAGFGGMARAAGPVLIDSLRKRGFDRGLVVDLGCGSGILSQAILEAGYEVLGIDISPAMIERAGSRAGRDLSRGIASDRQAAALHGRRRGRRMLQLPVRSPQYS